MTESTDLKAAVERLTQEISALRNDLVRKDVYDSDERRRTAELGDVRDDIKDLKGTTRRIEDGRSADKRLLLTSFALPIVLLILQLYLASQTGQV